MTTDVWYVYNTEMRMYKHMSMNLVFITQATGLSFGYSVSQLIKFTKLAQIEKSTSI